MRGEKEPMVMATLPSNRTFGWTFTAFFALVGLWPLIKHGNPRWVTLMVAALVMFITLARPALLTIPNRLWMKFGLLLHRITSPIILGILFFVVLTPTAIVMRLVHRDALRLRYDKSLSSYWIKRIPPGPSPESMINQF
jgi:saxitoxin biosynthesis operon SxtJ-like protein